MTYPEARKLVGKRILIARGISLIEECMIIEISDSKKYMCVEVLDRIYANTATENHKMVWLVMESVKFIEQLPDEAIDLTKIPFTELHISKEN